MKLRTLATLVREGWLLFRVARLAGPFYRLAWLASAASHDVLARLATGPVPLPRLARGLGIGPEGEGVLAAWLGVGLRLGELRGGPEGYSLRGSLARKLAVPQHDAVAAILQEAARLHHALILDTPGRLRTGQGWTLSDQDGALIARSSRVLEPLVCEAVDWILPRSGPLRLLEVGPGSATYIRHAASRNPALTALGVELQPDVARAATANLRAWGLEERARIETGDVRDRPPDRSFDVVTLHNNIYYFPVEERVALLRHLRGFLTPRGSVLLTTGCQGGSILLEVLNLWGASTRGCGRLPEAAEMCQQLERAGFESVRSKRLVPGESYLAFTAIAPG